MCPFVESSQQSEVSVFILQERLGDSALISLSQRQDAKSHTHDSSIMNAFLRSKVKLAVRFPFSCFKNTGGNGISAHDLLMEYMHYNRLWKCLRASESARLLSISQLSHRLASCWLWTCFIYWSFRYSSISGDTGSASIGLRELNGIKHLA